MRDFRRLEVWRRAHRLTLTVYSVSGEYPRAEAFGLTSQTRRAAASVPANIAEGCGRDGDREFARFLEIAGGSANELSYLLLLAHDLHYLSDETYSAIDSELSTVMKMLNSLTRTVRFGNTRQPSPDSILPD